MEFEEAKNRYLQAWGTLGTNWGISKVMAQIHALLLISPKPLCTDEIMAELSISRGNANMNIRLLMDWGIAEKILKPGDRKEYFTSEKDVTELAKKVMKERRKRELEPVIKVLKEVSEIKDNGTLEAKEFKKITKDLSSFAVEADNLLDFAMKSEGNWIFKTFMKLMS